MAHLQYMPGDPRLVDQLVYELKSKGIFDQFRKECIADVDTRPAYQNLRQRVESSVATFLSRQVWNPDLNKNQLREKLRKHLLDGNYLEQGVERIVDQVVNPKVASVFIPQVEDLVCNYLGIPRKKATIEPETSNGKPEDLLPTDLEAVSPGSVKSNDEKEDMDTSETKEEKMEVDDKPKLDLKDDSTTLDSVINKEETRLSGISELTINDSDVSIEKSTITIPLPAEEIKLENIPAPENSPPKIPKNIDLEKINLPKEPNLSTDIPLPDEIPHVETDSFFKPIASDDEDSSDSSLRRNMSPITPVRNFNTENSCDAQQGFNNDSDSKTDEKKEPSSFRFAIESKSIENSVDEKIEKKEEPATCQYNPPSDVNAFNTPMYDDSSNSNNLQIDYESDANSKTVDKVLEVDQNSVDSKKETKKEDKKSSSYKSSDRSRDSHRHSSSKEKRSDSKHSRDSSRHDKDKKSNSSKDSKDDKNENSKSSSKEKSNEKSEKKDSRDSSKHRSSSHKSSKDKDKDSKHRSSSSTSSSKHSSKDDKKPSSSSSRDKERSSSDKPKDKDSKDRSKDSKSSSSRDKDRKSSSSSKRSDEKENKEKKEKKETDDHYSLSGRGNPNRRSTDRDSNDGSSSSKGSHNPSHSKTSESKKASKSSSKSGHTSSSDSTPSDNVETHQARALLQSRPVVRVDSRLETPVSTPPRLPFVPNVTIKKPKFAANMQEAKHLMKMRKFLEEEQKRMNQEAALLLDFQANVRPNLSQVYSNISGPELEFICPAKETTETIVDTKEKSTNNSLKTEDIAKVNTTQELVEHHDEIAQTLIAMHDDGSDVNEDDNISQIDEKEHTNASILEDLTDHEDSTNDSETIEVSLERAENTDINNPEDDVIESKIEVSADDFENFNKSLVLEVKQESTDLDVKKNDFKYFSEQEKFDSELERNKFTNFLNKYTENLKSKMYLINCDPYEENIIREVAQNFGQFEIVNYIKNGHLKIAKTSKNIVKNVNIDTEITLPAKVEVTRPKTPDYEKDTSMFSPVKSECSFELSSDYDAKIEDMVNRTSRQEIMEIILGGAIDESSTKMPTIDYCVEENIEDNSLKRKITEVDCTVNNNRHVLTPNKLRKLSVTDQISSTTEESEVTPVVVPIMKPKSKFLGKARRVGLSRPKKCNIQNSPSSDKSVENYETNANDSSHGKMKSTPRSKVQRYDTSDLYKPKLHYLSRRNQIT